jgi:bacillithiol biosynthesis cysteine-adding enzyme BshC
MRIEKISFAETQSFTPLFLDYIQGKETIKKLYSLFPEISNFKKQIEQKKKSYPESNRVVLNKVLVNQYKNLKLKGAVKNNLDLLSNPNTFTITTGHQLNIFTGPLYFIYKIVTVINTCKQLKKSYPEYNFVPVYWMASEDHDYDEIKYFRLYGKKYTWVTDQHGAVGRFNPNSLDTLLKEVPGEITIFNNAYLKHSTLADAVRYYVNELFGEDGLISIDADDRDLKSEFKSVIADDLFNGTTKKLVDEQDNEIESLDYHPQVFVRDINFFFLDHQLRCRIEKKNDLFKVVDCNLSFSEEEIKKIIETEPEKFSPNVILRPLYQEIILPNLAYSGGPAEIVYWLQLKKVFDYHSIPYPVLLPRNFAAVIEPNVARKFAKTELEFKYLFEEKNLLFNHWILKHTSQDLSLGNAMKQFTEQYDSIRDRANKIDPTLTKYVSAQARKVLNGLEKIEEKMLRAEKRVHKEKLGQLESVKDTLFPNGSPQERVDNFLNFYQKDPQFIKRLLDLFDPFDFKFNLLFYDEE